MVGAALAPLVLWALTVPLLGVDLTARAGGVAQTVGPGAVVVAGLVCGLAAWVLLALLERTVRRAGRVWGIVAGAVLAVSLAGPLGSGADTAGVLVLCGMHVLVGAVLIPGMVRTGTG